MQAADEEYRDHVIAALQTIAPAVNQGFRRLQLWLEPSGAGLIGDLESYVASSVLLHQLPERTMD